jgi:hypothetical protein
VTGRVGSKSLLVLLISVLICFGSWRWVRYVLIPANTSAAQHGRVPIGNNSDLYARWLGARELLIHGRDPYTPAVTRELQEGFYGRALEAARSADPHDQQGFAYPVYIVFLLAPFVRYPFASVAYFAHWLILCGLAASLPLWMRAVGLQTTCVWTASGILLALSTYPSMMEFYMQNLSALVALLLALACVAAVREWLAMSGFLLALSTIKPQLSVFFILWLLLWVLGEWKSRRRLLISFSLALAGLVLSGEILLPGWIGKFLAAVRSYRSYTREPIGLGMFFPRIIAGAAAAALLVTLFFVGRRRRKSLAGSPEFAWMLAWVAATTLLLAPIQLYNQVLLIPALLALIAQRERIWSAGRVPRAMSKAVLLCLGWQWITAAMLGLATLVLPAERLQLAARVPVYTSLALPPITFLALLAETMVARTTETG